MTVTRESFLSAIARHAPTSQRARILLVVEGVNDIEFLRRISRLLHSHDASLPALAELEQRGELVFVPFGGGNVKAWTRRLAPLAMPEFHLYDRESPPETDQRRESAAAVNRRPRCWAALTRKRSLENYLHPRAIFATRGVDLTFEDFDPVAELAAQRVYEQGAYQPGVYQLGLNQTPWERLPRRAHRRLANRAKRWLNTLAADHMTVELLRQRDPQGEVMSWLKAIAGLLAEAR